MLLLGYYD